MFFDEELRDHLIAYLEDYPDSIICVTSHQDLCAGRFLITGNYSGRSGYGRRDDFQYEIYYTKEGNIYTINGEETKIEMKNLILAIKRAIKRNFKLKRKKTKLGV